MSASQLLQLSFANNRPGPSRFRRSPEREVCHGQQNLGDGGGHTSSLIRCLCGPQGPAARTIRAPTSAALASYGRQSGDEELELMARCVTAHSSVAASCASNLVRVATIETEGDHGSSHRTW